MEIRNGIFWGINFGPKFFWVLFEAQGILGGFDFCPHLIIPVTWNPEYPLWASVKLKRTLNFSHFPSQVNIFSDWKLCGGEQWINQTFFLKP